MNKHFATIVVVLNGILIFCFLGLRGWLPPVPEKTEEVFEHQKIEATRCRYCSTALDLSPGEEKRDGKIDNNAKNVSFIITKLGEISHNEEHFSFETPHLLFRKLDVNDADDIHAYLSNPRMAERIEWKKNQSKIETREYIDSLIKNTYLRIARHAPWAVINKETGTVIGTAEIYLYILREPRCNIGYLLSSEYWSSPYELEVIRALIEVSIVVLGCIATNSLAECHLPYARTQLEHAGMSCEGIEPDYKYINGKFVSYYSYNLLTQEVDPRLIQKSALANLTVSN